MKIILSNIIDIEEPSKELINFAKKQLTFTNPEVLKKKRLGFYCYGMDKEIKLYNIYNNHLYLPIGIFNELYKLHPINKDYVDYSVTRPVAIKNHITLRDYQVPVIQAVKEKINGIIIAPCGTGKTSMALACFGELKQKALWICNTMELLNQAKDRCEETIECATSVITDGKCDITGDIVFATVQTLVKCVEKGIIKQDTFGMLIVDEVHLLSCNPEGIQMFRQCVEYFSARYKISMTATLHRSDGLHECIKHIMGDIIYSIEQKGSDYCCIYNGETLLKFPVDKFQVPARIKVIETKYNIADKEVYAPNGGTVQYASLISDLAMNEDRNKILVNLLNSVAGSTLVLSDRVDQLKYLCTQVDNGVQIDGGTPKKIRKQAIEDVRSGKVKYLFASYNLARQGLDIPILSNLFLGTPVKDFAVVVQSIGRIQRPYEGKTVAQVYDFVDDVSMLYRFYSKRRSTYRKNNWEIENIYLGGS